MHVNRITYKVLNWDSKQKIKSWTNEHETYVEYLNVTNQN